MSRSLASGVSTAIAERVIRAELLASFAFDSGTVRFWSGLGPLSWAGNTYVGAGNLGSVSAVEESSEVKATGLVFQLSGIPSELLSVALGEHYQGRACNLWLGFFDGDDALIDDPIQLFGGRMDIMKVSDEGATCTIQVSAESRLVDLDRPDEVAYYTDADQQARFPGDKGFQFVPAMQEAVIVWGQKRLQPGTGAAPAGAAPAAPPAPPVNLTAGTQ